MEVHVAGLGSYTLWKDCAYCFVQGLLNNNVAPHTCQHTQSQTDSVPVRDPGGEMQGFYNDPPLYSPRQSFLRGSNDSKITIFPDTDSGFSSVRRGMSGDELSPQMSPGALVRSQSIGKLNGSMELSPLAPTPYIRTQFDRSLRHLQGSLEDSENRRCVLMHKLKEAQDTLELQSERLGKIENSAKGNTILVEDLRLKENEYRKKINMLERGQDEKDMLKMENIRLRQEMQDRIDKLDFALRSLQAQHQVAESENQKRIELLDQSTKALTMLEADNNQLQQERDILKRDHAVAREAMQFSRERFEPMEQENKNLRLEVMRLKEENADLTKKLAEMSGQLAELRKLTQSMKDENEKLAASWKSIAEEKHSLAHQLKESQENMVDFKAKASTNGHEKDRLFQEKMDLNNKFQQLLINKEQIERAKIEMEDQLGEIHDELSRAQNNVRKKEDGISRLEESLHAAKQDNQDLQSELSSVRAYYERALEQISVLENGKKVSSQQQEWVVQEKERLQNEVDRLNKVADGRAKELKREREELEDAIQTLKGETRDLRHENSLLHNKTQELDTKLRKANEDLKVTATVQQEELDTWKDTCDRLTASVHKKESEVQALLDRVDDLEEYTSKLKGENRSLKDECETLTEEHDDIKKLKNENKKLIQENAENEQVIKLLETQKEVLTKSSESSLAKLHNVEQLTGKCEQLRSDNEHLRERILELEKVRDNLLTQKEELLASAELKPKVKELEQKIEELRDTNNQLREINENVSEQCENLEQKHVTPINASLSMRDPEFEEVVHENLVVPEQSVRNRSMPLQHSSQSLDTINENTEMRDAIGGEGALVPKVEMERVEEEKERMTDEMDQMRREFQNLSERHSQYVQDYGPEGDLAHQDKDKVRALEREKEGLEKQVALINGQLLLVEGSKKRLDEVVEDLQHEIVHLRRELEEAEKQPVSNAEMEALQTEIDNLREVLSKSQTERLQQNQIIKNLKEKTKKPSQPDLDDEKSKGSSLMKESLEDVGTDLNDMRGELQKLMGVIQSKDQAIEMLEGQLRRSKENAHSKERAMDEMKVLMESTEPKHSSDSNGFEEDSRRTSRSPQRSSRIPRRTEDENQKKTEDRPRLTSSPRPMSSYMNSHLSLKDVHNLRTSDPDPRRSASAGDKSSDRLQSLISKYRSHSESPFPERKIKPLSLQGSSNKMGLVTRGRSFGPTAPKDADGKVSVSSDTTDTSVNGAHDNDVFVSPVPSPDLPTVKVVSPEQGEGYDEQSGPESNEGDVGENGNGHSENALGQFQNRGRFRQGGGGDVDLMEDMFPDYDEPIDEVDLDTQEQNDINALIQKRSTHPKPLLSVSPPKLTSKIIAGLLKTGPPTSSNSMPSTSKSAPSSLLSQANVLSQRQ